MTRILCVCLGNICRSPTAEAVLRKLGEGRAIEVDSAGTSDWHIGDAPYPPAIVAGRSRGYDLSPLKARQVSVRDFHEFDVILAMDAKNLSALVAMAPADATARVELFLDHAPDIGKSEIPDPYYTRDFDGALDLIETAARGLLKSL